MKNTLTILVLTLLAFSFNSCSKEGCTDPDSENFCEECKREDHSCTYKCSVVFWYNSVVANNLVNDGAVTLYYYVNGNLIGSSAANVYWSSAPDCNQGGSLSFTKDMGTSKSMSESYQVKDQTGYVYWSGTVSYEGGKCKTMELLW